MRRKELPIGAKYGRLTVRSNYVGQSSGRPRMICSCACDCGGSVDVTATRLQSGNTKSCGCLQPETAATINSTHKHTSGGVSPTYFTWFNMLTRCNNATAPQFKNYGARGIKVCERWADFENFLDDMGKRPEGRTLDRLDNNGHYNRENCRWATTTQQANNTRQNRYITHNGKTQSLALWAAESGLKYMTLFTRLQNGWTFEAAITEPLRPSRWSN